VPQQTKRLYDREVIRVSKLLTLQGRVTFSLHNSQESSNSELDYGNKFADAGTASFSAWDSAGSGRWKVKAFAVVLRATLEQF
jgi:hypothetical protein